MTRFGSASDKESRQIYEAWRALKTLKTVPGPGTIPLPKAILARRVVGCFTVFNSTINFSDARQLWHN